MCLFAEISNLPQCHLRLATPKHAQVLVGYFRDHKHTQSQGLDDIGALTDAELGSITTELVVGKREELYWQKVPEKIRKQAVQKVVDVMQRNGASINGKNNITGTPDLDGNEEGEMKRKKRRKH